MKLRGIYVFPLIIAVTLLAGFYPYRSRSSAEEPKENVLLKTMMAFIDQLHFSPKNLDDAFSRSLYTYYLEDMDGYHRFFTQEDLKKLSAQEAQLDDQIRGGTVQFFEDSYSMLNASLTKTQGYYREILAQPFDFTTREQFEIDPEKRPFARNDAELKDLWRKYLKYETLDRLLDKVKSQEKDSGDNAEIPLKLS